MRRPLLASRQVPEGRAVGHPSGPEPAQQPTESLDRPREVHAHRGDCDPEHLGDLTPAEPIDPAEPRNLLRARWEGPECRFDRRMQLPTLDQCVRRSRRSLGVFAFVTERSRHRASIRAWGSC